MALWLTFQGSGRLQAPEPSRDPYPRAAKLWMWTGVVFFSWPILADVAHSHGTGDLREVGTFWAAFMAIAHAADLWPKLRGHE